MEPFYFVCWLGAIKQAWLKSMQTVHQFTLSLQQPPVLLLLDSLSGVRKHSSCAVQRELIFHISESWHVCSAARGLSQSADTSAEQQHSQKGLLVLQSQAISSNLYRGIKVVLMHL